MKEKTKGVIQIEWGETAWGVAVRRSRGARRLADWPDPAGEFRSRRTRFLGSLSAWNTPGEGRHGWNRRRPFFFQQRGFTLIELLVVIAIIGILAAILLPAVLKGKVSAQVSATKTEMRGLHAAISSYEGDYGFLPAAWRGQDRTLGFPGDTNSNAELMVILTNQDHPMYNPGKKRSYKGGGEFSPKRVSNTTSPGLSNVDQVYRDIWGQPFIISMDLNSDGKTLDRVYKRSQVSSLDGKRGRVGLFDENGDGEFEFHGSVMIWSLGPDRNMRRTPSHGWAFDAAGTESTAADQGINRDNILSWQ